jgi:putative ABC transport system permease protein
MQTISLLRNIRLGVKSLLLHKLRSFLTILGVIFGVGSVVAMLSVGEGASAEAMKQIEQLGPRNIIMSSVKPQSDKRAAAAARRTFTSVYGLLYEDNQRIRNTLPTVARTVPAKIATREARLGDRSFEVRMVGTTPDWFDMVSRPVLAGRPLTWHDMQEKAAVVVLAENPARRLLAGSHTIGQTVHIGSDSFRVVGIVQPQGAGGDVQTPDLAIDAYVPLDVFRQRMGDLITQRSAGSFIRERVELHKLIVEVDQRAHVEATAEAIRTLLQRFHKKQDYVITVPLALLNQARQTQRIFNIVLGSIAGISLLVGGIGIMNIMLASVTERTREIGVRRAIGAKRRHIIGQFLTETVVLSTTGGLLGVAVGLVIPFVITRVADMPTVISGWSILLSLGISAAVGILFGLYPAYRAAMLDPIVALRSE